MNKIFLGLVCSFALLGGCGEGGRKQPAGKVSLPDDIVGTWRAESTVTPIEITVSRQGRVVSAVITPGNVLVAPNATTQVEMQDGTFSTYTTGDFLMEYAPDVRELTVELQLTQMQLLIGDAKIEGHKRDIFAGTVSEDGKVWDTTWMEIFDFGPQFPMDPDAIGVALRFVKIDE